MATTSGRETVGGVNRREYFAGQALAGILANPGGPVQANGMNGWAITNCTEDDIAGFALSMADALLRALATDPAGAQSEAQR